MCADAQISAVRPHRDMRHQVRHPVVGRHHRIGDIPLVIANVSAKGFMANCAPGLGRGDRVSIRLPVIGGIEAHVAWTSPDRSGFQFERMIRADDLSELVAAM